MRVSWRTVGDIVGRVVGRHKEAHGVALDRLAHIGIDEISCRRHHEYITTVVNHESGKVIWASPGKNAATLRRFFHDLGPERSSRLKTVTIDMSTAFSLGCGHPCPLFSTPLTFH